MSQNGELRRSTRKKNQIEKKETAKEASKEDVSGSESDSSGEGTHSFVKRKKLEEKLRVVEESGVLDTRAAPEVDEECKELVGRTHVYANAQGIYYDAMLNQTNIQQNNNKFFKMQLLESTVGDGGYWHWLRWGRVGFRGQTNLKAFGSDLEGALKSFHSKFYEKTSNKFLEGQGEFKKVQGKYDLIRIDYTRKVQKTVEDTNTTDENGNGQENGEMNNNAEKPKMDERVLKLMQTLCDLKRMESEARRLDYDFKRIPLGKITKEQIKAGYEALTRIEKHIRDNAFGQDFTEAVNQYYTRIPHSFGMRTPPPIRTLDSLKQEIELLDLLTGIEIAVAEIAGDPLEHHYNRLRWELTPLEQNDEKYKLIEEYLVNTQGPTHNQYKLQLRSVFELRKKEEDENTTKRSKKKQKKRMLLWHGSRLTNWYSILAQGLRIAPPEAPVTGYMFGKGVYFADMSSKSANYSLSGPDAPGFMLLSEVTLGEMVELKNGDHEMHLKLPKGKHSVKGIGRIAPDPDGSKIIDDGVEVPSGKPKEEEIDDASLIYNEYIVYNRDQIKERFLVEIAYQFDFQI